jgi:hypothetical protein
VVGFFPHLFGEIEMAFCALEVRINAERERAVYDKFCRVKERDEEFHGVAFVFGHFGPVIEVFFEGYFVGKPRVSDGLVVQIVRPRVHRGMQIVIFW